jgi:hypothetical protein
MLAGLVLTAQRLVLLAQGTVPSFTTASACAMLAGLVPTALAAAAATSAANSVAVPLLGMLATRIQVIHATRTAKDAEATAVAAMLMVVVMTATPVVSPIGPIPSPRTSTPMASCRKPRCTLHIHLNQKVTFPTFSWTGMQMETVC